MPVVQSRRIYGVLLILLAAALWGAVGPVAKIAFAEGVAPLEVAAWRAIIGWLFFVIHAGVRRAVAIEFRDVPVMIFFALISVTGFFGTYQLAIEIAGAARAAVLLYTAPAWVTVMAALFLKEPLRGVTVLSVLASVVGVALVSISGDGSAGSTIAAAVDPAPAAGIFFGLVAGFTYALYYILGRRILARYPAVTVFAWILLIGGVGLLPFVSLALPSLRAAGALLFIGFASTYCAYAAYAGGLLRLRSSQASVIATMEPVVAALLALLFWQENLGLLGYVGAVLVVGSVLVASVIRDSESEG